MREIKTRWSFSLKSLQIWTISFHLMFIIPIQLQLLCGLLDSFFLLSRSPMQLSHRYFQWFSISYTNLLPGFILQLQPISKASKPCLSRSSFPLTSFSLCLSAFPKKQLKGKCIWQLYVIEIELALYMMIPQVPQDLPVLRTVMSICESGC